MICEFCDAGNETNFLVLLDYEQYQMCNDCQLRHWREHKNVDIKWLSEREDRLELRNSASEASASLGNNSHDHDGSFCHLCGPTNCTCKPIPKVLKLSENNIIMSFNEAENGPDLV